MKAPPNDDPDKEPLLGAISEEYLQWFNSQFEQMSKLSAGFVEINKQHSSFYERLLLLDLGIIGLTVTGAVSLVPKIAASPLPDLPVFVCTLAAWAFLLFSAGCCGSVMRTTLNINTGFYERLSRYSERQFTMSLLATMRSINRSINNVAGDPKSIHEVRAEIGKAFEAEMVYHRSALEMPFRNQNAESYKLMSMLAQIFADLGLIFLCTVAAMLFFKI